MAKRGFTFNISGTSEEMVQTHFPPNEIRNALVMYVPKDDAPDAQPTIAIVWDDEEEPVPPVEQPQRPRIWTPGG